MAFSHEGYAHCAVVTSCPWPQSLFQVGNENEVVSSNQPIRRHFRGKHHNEECLDHCFEATKFSQSAEFSVVFHCESSFLAVLAKFYVS